MGNLPFTSMILAMDFINRGTVDFGGATGSVLDANMISRRTSDRSFTRGDTHATTENGRTELAGFIATRHFVAG